MKTWVPFNFRADRITDVLVLWVVKRTMMCAFDIVDMFPYTISLNSARYKLRIIGPTDGKVRIEIILLLENNKMLPRKIKTEKK